MKNWIGYLPAEFRHGDDIIFAAHVTDYGLCVSVEDTISAVIDLWGNVVDYERQATVIDRETALEFHAWLTEELYGPDQ